MVVVCIRPFLSGSLLNIVEVYLSFVLQLISVACQAVTMITYAIFPELRNLPGVNLMSLNLNMFIAQVR